jgi:hypothetical protein
MKLSIKTLAFSICIVLALFAFVPKIKRLLSLTQVMVERITALLFMIIKKKILLEKLL